MKKLCKFSSLVLAVLMAVSMLLAASGIEIFIIASSDEYAGYATSAKYLETISVLKGYDDGDLHLGDPIERYQAALFFGRIMTGVVDESAWGTGKSEKFTDVPEYGPTIDLISEMGVIRGYGDRVFGYHDGIRYQDMCAMMVRALGYETDDMPAAYPMSYVLKVEELGLDLEGVKPADFLNRGQTAQMVYDALTTEITETTDEKDLAIAKLISKNNQDADETKDTYLERNFDVSSTMYFQICATENYSMDGAFAEEDKFDARLMTKNGDDRWTFGDKWSFTIEGSAAADVTEADLIGKYMELVFDDKEPTQDKLDDEKCAIVHAEVIAADAYENLGELSYVKYDEKKPVLSLGRIKVDFDKTTAPKVYLQTADKGLVIEEISYEDLFGRMDGDTYFRIEAYDADSDGEYDALVYIPYSFGQYAKRTYSGKDYVLIGKYHDSFVYDVSSTAEKSGENRTHFVEYLLPATDGAKIAAGSLTSYKPGDTTVRVGESAGELSAQVTVSGAEVKTGDFILYSYNELSNKMYVAVNLGTYLTGAVTGIKPGSQMYNIDGSYMGVGLPGALSDAKGLLTEGGFAQTEAAVRTMIANYEKGKSNIRYLEYDGKLVYAESFADSDVEVGDDFAIIDIEETLETYQDTFDDPEDAWDIPYDGDCALVKRYIPDTDSYEDIKVEKLVIRGVEKAYTFRTPEEHHEVGSYPDMYAYNLFVKGGALYAIEDEDNNGEYELYAYGTEDYGVLGAAITEVAAGKPSVYFTYGKSNNFIEENTLGIPTDRVTTTADFVAVVIGQDGYKTLKGVIGDSSSNIKDNELYLSDAAQVLAVNTKSLVIFDPVGYTSFDLAEGKNVFGNNPDSLWNSGKSKDDGLKYYMMIQASSYVDSGLYCDDEGEPIKTDDGKSLYTHTYKKLFNLATKKNEDVMIISKDKNAPAEEIINSIDGVIRVDAENYEADITSFGDFFVEHGDYRYGSFERLADKDKINFTTQPKDENGNGRIDPGEEAVTLRYYADEEAEYQTLNSLSITFIDLDEGADVDYRDYSFADSYLFYLESESNKRYYASVTLEDRTAGVDYPASGTFPIKRFNFNGSEFSDKSVNGKVSTLTKGDRGYYGDAYFWRYNGWADYLIPAVDDEGDTIWTYEGSLRVKVTYYSFIDYDEDAQTVDAVVVRVGKISGTVGAGEEVIVPTLPEE